MWTSIAIGPWYAGLITEQDQILSCEWKFEWLLSECCRWSHCVPTVLCKVCDSYH